MPKRVTEDGGDGARDPLEAKASRRIVKVSKSFR